jgi:predicted porin
MNLRKSHLAAAVGAALLAGGTVVHAQAPTVQVYGQVSRALLFADDGTQSKWFHVDNEASGTRFGFTGNAQAMPGLRYGFRIELDLQSNESQRVNFSPPDRFPTSRGRAVGPLASASLSATWIRGSKAAGAG